MPSHAAHLLFALEVLAKETRQQAKDIESINLGAQLPDVFYHNRRTQPSGLYISVAMHRRGFALLTSHLLARSKTISEAQTALAFLSHGVLDRFLHPWINAFTGWYDPAKTGSLAYRFQHPLCERMIDLWICGRKDALWMLGPGFIQHWTSPEKTIVQGFSDLVSEIYPRCKNDANLAIRLDNAFGDCTGYYRWTSTLDESAYRKGIQEVKNAWEQRKKTGEDEELEPALRFGSLVHPRFPTNPEKASNFLDSIFENTDSVWIDPCHDRIESNSSFGQVWKSAEHELKRLIGVLGIDLARSFAAEQWTENTNRPRQAEIYELLIENGFHDGDLRSRNQGDAGCDLDVCKPIDWFQVWFELEGMKN